MAELACEWFMVVEMTRGEAVCNPCMSIAGPPPSAAKCRTPSLLTPQFLRFPPARGMHYFDVLA